MVPGTVPNADSHAWGVFSMPKKGAKTSNLERERELQDGCSLMTHFLKPFQQYTTETMMDVDGFKQLVLI